MEPINLNEKIQEKWIKIGIIVLLFLAIFFIIIFGIIFLNNVYHDKYKKIFGIELKDSLRSNQPAIDTSHLKQIEKTKKDIKYNITAPITHSAVGDNATTNNYNGIKQRHLDQKTFKVLLYRLDRVGAEPRNLSKNKIELSINSGDAEMGIYGEEIKKKLEKERFRVEIFDGPVPFDKNEILIIKTDSGAIVGVKPARNISN